MKFSYHARTKEGDIQTGVIEASSKSAALEILQQYELYVTSLRQAQGPLWQKRIAFLGEASKGDIISFTRQLSIMLKSGISLVESLETIAQQVKKIGFREKILKIVDRIEGGANFSKTLSGFPEFFSPFYVGMMKSGEASGRVPESLDYLADYLEKEQDFTSKLIGAMIYPAFVIAVFFLLILIIGAFVVPSFEEVFIEMGIELPFLTMIVISLSKFIKKGWWFLLLCLAACVSLVIFFLKEEKNKRRLDHFSLELPLIGNFLKKLYLSRIALNLSTLISGGVPISQALEITRDLIENSVYKEILIKARSGVRTGRPISSVLSVYPDSFPFLFIQMVVVGEKTGHLDQSLQNIVVFYEKDVKNTLDMLIKLLEPTLIICLGFFVALFAISLFVPLFQQGLSL